MCIRDSYNAARPIRWRLGLSAPSQISAVPLEPSSPSSAQYPTANLATGTRSNPSPSGSFGGVNSDSATEQVGPSAAKLTAPLNQKYTTARMISYKFDQYGIFTVVFNLSLIHISGQLPRLCLKQVRRPIPFMLPQPDIMARQRKKQSDGTLMPCSGQVH